MIDNTTAAMFCLASWVLGCFYGAYRYERLWKDRTLVEIFRAYREL